VAEATKQFIAFDLSALKLQLLSTPRKFGASYGIKVVDDYKTPLEAGLSDGNLPLQKSSCSAEPCLPCIA
jgi:hypothetical protein